MKGECKMNWKEIVANTIAVIIFTCGILAVIDSIYGLICISAL